MIQREFLLCSFRKEIMFCFLTIKGTASVLTLSHLSPASRCSLLMFMAMEFPDHLQLSAQWLSLGLSLGRLEVPGKMMPCIPAASSKQRMRVKRIFGALFHTISHRPLAGLACVQRGFLSHLLLITPRNMAEVSSPCLRSVPLGCKLR